MRLRILTVYMKEIVVENAKDVSTGVRKHMGKEQECLCYTDDTGEHTITMAEVVAWKRAA